MDALLMRRHTAAQLLLGAHPCGAGGLLRQTAPGSRWREHGACCSELLDRVVEHFSRQAAAHGAALCQGIIHGDANEQNVLVAWHGGATAGWRIAGLLDFGASHVHYWEPEVISARACPSGLLQRHSGPAAALPHI
jgi:hypothetical protein